MNKVSRLLAIPALLLGLNVMSAAAEDRGCSNATLKGDYGYSVNGTSLDIPPVGPLAILGKITLDGKGNFAGTINGSIGGTLITDVAITGTYSIGSDCTGTVVTVYPAFTAHFTLVLIDGVEGRREAELLSLDAGTVGTGAFKPAKFGCDHDHE